MPDLDKVVLDPELTLREAVALQRLAFRMSIPPKTPWPDEAGEVAVVLRDASKKLALVAGICPTCHGEGEVRHNPGWPDPQTETSDRCPDCGGSGEACEHEWVDARNQAVISGEVCQNCGAVRAGNEATT